MDSEILVTGLRFYPLDPEPKCFNLMQHISSQEL